MDSKKGFKQTEIGAIPRDWHIEPLTELIGHIVDNRGRTAPTSDTGIALIATNCIKEDGLYPTKEKIRFISEETYKNWFRDHPKPGDIIIVNKGTPGLVCLVPDPVDFCIAQDMVSVRPDENKIYGKFLFAFMRSKLFKHEVDSLNVGTTIPHLKKTYFPMLKILIPPKIEQKIIGDIYYNLTLKIELNQQMNKTLESIGQALFKHWFIDFEFPDKGGKPYKSSGGEMVYSEELEKEIPKDWEVKPIDKIAYFLNGLALQKYPVTGDEYLPVIKIREMKQGITENTDKASPNIPEEYVVNDGDILFSWSGSLGICIWGRGKGALNQHLFKVTSDEYPKWFYYYWIKQYLPKFIHIAAGKATTMGHIKRNHLSESFVVIPPNQIIEKLNNLITPTFNKIIENSIELRYLELIRDALLPKLMSGKIRVKVPESEATV